VWTTEVDDPTSVGILVMKDGEPDRVVEKPREPVGNLGLTGIYLFDSSVWGIINRLSPSTRGEYEVTDILQAYLERGKLSYTKLAGEWLDLGQSLNQFLESSSKVRECMY
jgi:glucose-1-phosphate thymidylyltransferase